MNFEIFQSYFISFFFFTHSENSNSKIFFYNESIDYYAIFEYKKTRLGNLKPVIM